MGVYRFQLSSLRSWCLHVIVIGSRRLGLVSPHGGALLRRAEDARVDLVLVAVPKGVRRERAHAGESNLLRVCKCVCVSVSVSVSKCGVCKCIRL